MTNQARFTIASLLEGKSALVQITPVAADRKFARNRGRRAPEIERIRPRN